MGCNRCNLSLGSIVSHVLCCHLHQINVLVARHVVSVNANQPGLNLPALPVLRR
jgi:hypothetical protein